MHSHSKADDVDTSDGTWVTRRYLYRSYTRRKEISTCNVTTCEERSSGVRSVTADSMPLWRHALQPWEELEVSQGKAILALKLGTALGNKSHSKKSKLQDINASWFKPEPLIQTTMATYSNRHIATVWVARDLPLDLLVKTGIEWPKWRTVTMHSSRRRILKYFARKSWGGWLHNMNDAYQNSL